MFIGIAALDPFLFGGELSRAGLGNTFSDVVGAFAATFVGDAIARANPEATSQIPVWAFAVGIFVGTLLGIAIPRVFIKDN